MKKILSILVLSLFLIHPVSATSSVKDDFDILRFEEMQILAINVEVMLPFRWSGLSRPFLDVNKMYQ